MNKNSFKGRCNLNNLGMSPILIVLVVLIVFVLGGIGVGVYVYTKNPFLRVYDSVTKLQNVKEVKSFEGSGNVSIDLNPGKLLKKFDKSGGDMELPESEMLLSKLDRDSTITYGLTAKYDIEKGTILSGGALTTKNFDLGNEFKDILDSEGTIIDAEAYIEGMQNLEKGKAPNKYFFRLNKLPNYIPLPSGQGFEKISLSSLTGSWVDITEVYSQALNTSVKNGMMDYSDRDIKKEIAQKTPNTIFTCEKKTLTFIDRVYLAGIGTSSDLFSKSVNKGTVDLDGIKATQLDFEVDMNKKSNIIKKLDEMSKITCKDASDLENDKFVELLADELGLSKVKMSYFVDNKTGYITKTSMEIVFDEKRFDSKFNIRSEVSIKNINNTKVEAPTNVKTFEKYMEENVSQLEKEFSKLTGAGSMSSTTGGMPSKGLLCPLTPKNLAEVTAACNTSSTTVGFKDRAGYCSCYWSQYQLSACNDDEGRYQKVSANCSRFIK